MRAIEDEPPDFVELWNGMRIDMWQDYQLSGLADMISSVHLCYGLLTLTKSGMLDRLRAEQPCSRTTLLADLDPEIGREYLRYLTITGVLEEFDGGYRLSRRGTLLTNDVGLARLGFYLEAYGPVVQHMTGLLDGTAMYGSDVARAPAALGLYSGTVATHSYLPIIREVMREQAVTSMLDLGCGNGSLLVRMCQEDPEMVGVGIDIAPEVIGEARALAGRVGVADRVSFDVADAFSPMTWPDGSSRTEIICGIGVLHELFRDGEDAVISVLDAYAERLSGSRTLLLGEPELRYDNRENDSDFFLVHVLTGQGIPRDRSGWLALFGRSRLRCVRVYTNAVAGPRTCFYKLTPRR